MKISNTHNDGWRKIVAAIFSIIVYHVNYIHGYPLRRKLLCFYILSIIYVLHSMARLMTLKCTRLLELP